MQSRGRGHPFGQDRLQRAAGLAELVTDGTAPGEPDVYNTAFADFSANFIVPKMVQRVVVDGLSIEAAMEEAQQQGQAIYDKYR